MNEETLIGSCGAVGFLIAAAPTCLLIISEVLGISKGKTNGILHFAICIVKKIIKKEPIRNNEILACVRDLEEQEEKINI